ncbi:MAG: M20 family metallopeptidase [Oscillospiraceae bacterium]|nr:M20 family metallopeptidase [Oscillospiraceae bacterium]
MDIKQRITRRTEEILPDLIALSDTIWQHPEYNFQEYHACQAMSSLLKDYGFQVQTGIGGLETSVKAEYDSGKPGPNIGIFGEFDAVPGMGHACGHNLMCAMAVGAGEALHSVIDDLGGKVTVLGCPAEEGGGGKITMLENGAFDGLDVGMLLHSASDTVVNDISYSRTDLLVHFYGKKAHAATWPEEGISALNPILDLFNIVNSMRLELADRGKILGIIRDGGEQPIYIPDHCSAEFTIRSFSMKYKFELLDRFLSICRHLAEITNTRFEYEYVGLSYEDIRNNPVIERLLEANFTALGETVKPREKELGIGCTDMGNVTHAIPALQSYVLVVPETRGHTPEFEAAVGGPAGHKTIAVGSQAMAMTAADIIQSPDVLAEIRKAFADMKAKYE